MELKARFDEESNIEWAKALEREGVHVVYGLVGLKVHSKVALVVRREGDIMRRYVHLATGNYNPLPRACTPTSVCSPATNRSARMPPTCSTTSPVTRAKTDFRKLLVAPVTLRRRLEGLILREIEIAKHGGKGHLIFKMNALEDPEMIRLLYQASQAGVQVDLLVRGLCCLRPGIPGSATDIRVISVIGRFLEHTRIYYFRNGGREEIYLGSADLMLRNLNHRIEIVFPVESPGLVQRLRNEILEVYLADTANAYQAHSDGSYTRAPRSETSGGVDSQQRSMTRRNPRGHWNERL